MPFPYETSATPVRVRRTKDKDTRSTASSSSGKKPKRSGSSNRSPPRADRSSQLALYTQQNLTLDQLPALPESGTASPGSAASPTLRGSTCPTTPPIDPAAAPQLYTPAALQKYLQTEDEQSHHEDGPPPVSYQESSRGLLDASHGLQADSLPLDSHTSTPLATSVREHPNTSQHRSSSPSFFYQPAPFYEPNSPQTSSSRIEESRSYTVSSPPPSSSSPSVYRPNCGPGFLELEQPQPRPHFAYYGSPPTLAPAIPANSASSNHYQATPAYPGPYYYPMTQPTSHHVDLHSLPPPNISQYANYSGLLHNPNYFTPSHYAPQRAQSSASSRMNLTGEPLSLSQPVFAHAHMETTPSLDSPGLSRESREDDAVDLLQRIQSAIPDINLLLSRYRETSGELGLRENLVKETEAQKTAALKQNESHIEKLGKELEDMKNKYSAESSKLRFEISNMEEKQKELRDSLLAERKSKDDLQAKNHALLTESERVRSILEEEKSRVVNESEDWRGKAVKALEDKEALEETLRRQKEVANAALQSRLADLGRTHTKEKETLLANLARQKTDLEAAHARARQELERDIGAHQTTMEESRREHAQDKEAWEKERAVLGKGSEEQRKILASHHQKDIEEIRKSQEASETLIRKQAQDKTASLNDQIERLKANWVAEQASFAKSTADLKTRAARIDDENKKLQTLAETFGEVTQLKSREDPFYQDAFRHLEKQVIDLAAEHFLDGPYSLPEETIRAAVTGLPHEFSSIGSSPQFRRAFVEHRISSVINQRIFEPFLFVLSGRLRSADQLFTEMSRNLKHKSTRREIQWRQRTLHAAYMASSAKAETNNLGKDVTNEIVDAIKFLADRGRLQHVAAAVRRIVKTAVETWRYARLESSMVLASMDKDDIAKASHEAAVQEARPPDADRKALLTLFPLIKREAAYGIVDNDYQLIDNGLVYSHGRVFNAVETSRHGARVKAQGRNASVDVTPPNDADTVEEPKATKIARSQSPLVPTAFSTIGSPQDGRRGGSLWDGVPNPKANHGGSDRAPPSHPDPGSEMQPTESEDINKTPASSRQPSTTTTASDNSMHSTPRPISGSDPGKRRRPSRSTSIIVDMAPGY